MKISIQEIPDSGLELTEDFDAKIWDIETDEIKYSDRVKVHAKINRDEDIVVVDLTAEGIMQLECARCLDVVDIPLFAELKLHYDAKVPETVDLGEKIREELMLNYPMKFVCDETCKGLCYSCGKNLNKESCKCSQKMWENPHMQFKKPGNDVK